MTVRKYMQDGKPYWLAKRSVAGEIKQKWFPGTPAGEKKALRFDAELEKAQKESRKDRSTYIRSKYGFLRGLCISKNWYDGKLITVFIYSLRGPDGHWHHRSLEVRCGRTFKSCFTVMVEDIIKILKITKYTRSTPGFKKLIDDTYAYVRAKDKANRSVEEPKPVKRSSKIYRRGARK